jgi:hypothetical protein
VRLACIPTAKITTTKQMQAMWAAVVERNEARDPAELKAARAKADLKEHVRRFGPEVREHHKQWVAANALDVAGETSEFKPPIPLPSTPRSSLHWVSGWLQRRKQKSKPQHTPLSFQLANVAPFCFRRVARASRSPGQLRPSTAWTKSIREMACLSRPGLGDLGCVKGAYRGGQRAGGAQKNGSTGGLLPKTTELHTGIPKGPKNNEVAHRMSKWAQKQRS